MRVCWGFLSVPQPLQTVQRAELRGVILALQSSGVVHLGVDNLNVVRHVRRLLDGRAGSSPVELVNDGAAVFIMLLLTLGVTFLVFVVGGVLLSWIFVVPSSLCV